MKRPAEIAFGPMLIGFAFNTILYGIMITQVYLYFTTFKHDRLWMKSFVVLLLVADTANTAFDFIYIYRTLVLHFGDFEVLTTADWIFATEPATTGIIASFVQCFFAWRIRVLTHNTPLAMVVCSGALAGGAGAIATAFEVVGTPRFVDFRNFKGVVILWLASESITDIIITISLVWHLWVSLPRVIVYNSDERKHKTGFQASDMMVDRIIRITIQTGFLTSLVATLDMVFFLTDPTGTHLMFNFILSKLYTNSLMSSLNSRRSWKYGSSTGQFTAVRSDTCLNGPINSSIMEPPISPKRISNPRLWGIHRPSFSSAPRRRSLSLAENGSGEGLEVPKLTPGDNRPGAGIFVEVESHLPRDPRGRNTNTGHSEELTDRQGPPASPKMQEVRGCQSLDTGLSELLSEQGLPPGCKAKDLEANEEYQITSLRTSRTDKP